MQRQAGLRLIGSRSSPQTRRLQEFAGRNWLPHTWLDLDVDPAADAVLSHQGVSRAATPVVVMPGGELLRRPSNAELALAAGIGGRPNPGRVFDVAIIGVGLAGLAATASATPSTLMPLPAVQVAGRLGVIPWAVSR